MLLTELGSTFPKLPLRSALHSKRLVSDGFMDGIDDSVGRGEIDGSILGEYEGFSDRMIDGVCEGMFVVDEGFVSFSDIAGDNEASSLLSVSRLRSSKF